MLSLPLRPDWSASLAPGDRDRLVAHWQRLSPVCLRRRFLRAMSPEALEGRAGAALSGEARCFGWFHEGTLRAVAELFPAADGTGEAAFTVERGWRKRGVGRALLRRVLRRGRNLGLARVIVLTTPDNIAMIRLARSEGGAIRLENGDVTGVFALPGATPVSLALDLADEAGAGFATLADGGRRLAAAWLGAEPRRAA